MSKDEGLDLRDEITAICEKLGIEHDKTLRIELLPTSCEATVLLPLGAKTETLNFKVSHS